MSLKDLTSAKHAEAESTPFMKAVFAKTLPFDLWVDWTYQKWLFYGAIEGAAGANRLLGDLPDLRRAFYLFMDYNEMNVERKKHEFRPIAIDYYKYLISIANDPNKIMAHLYTWHMGDMFGGQMIKKIMPGPHRNLEFDNPDELKVKIRSKLNVGMADEANIAFEWAIKLMETYTDELDLANAD
jgi:heme oxygenase